MVNVFMYRNWNDQHIFQNVALSDLFYGCIQHLLFNFVGAEGLRIEFDRQCSTERRHDPLTVMDGANRIVSVRSGDRSKTINFNFHQIHVKPKDQN